MELDSWLQDNLPCTDITNVSPLVGETNTWREIRLFLSSTFIDTHSERDVIIKRVIPSINRKLASRLIRIIPVDLRWGVLAEESKDCEAIQKTCLNQLDKCRQNIDECPWFLGLRTERYGWVQNELMPSKNFENPGKYEWIDKFHKYGKNVSITSLECIHASLPPLRWPGTPTVFFYKRDISNYENIENNMRWVFDFEYVLPDADLQPEVQYQYVKNENADIYKKDRDNLDNYLKNLTHAKYSTYQCYYEKGGAKFTSKNEGKKSFGVGYVTGLSAFEKQVEKDLLDAVESNFEKVDEPDIPKHVFQTAQHENAVKFKASTFVGRAELRRTCYNHCTSNDVSNNVLIIHGEPGCGKSGLLAATTKQCLDDLRGKGEFIFAHFVDSCPGSDSLEAMLRRLQLNLRSYRRNLGETEISEECPTNVGDLKSEHLTFLETSAVKHHDKRFVILVDATNQFHQSLQAWKMWWLPSGETPKNIRIIITTLTVDNGTFQNACTVCPNASIIKVDVMSQEDRQEMVTATLARFNKKLTTKNDSFLGNQMDVLLDKSESPLYLIAATEALRKFGIFEKVNEYISSLPESISELFSFLLDDWSKEYGERFTKDVTGLLCVSKDGLLENEINDLLSYKEYTEGFFYDCSFSRLYDSLCSFLAAGGGGFLRFFHDQLKFEVGRKFFIPEVEQELHKWLTNFYLDCIQPQLCEESDIDAPAYYKHCLQQVVYHQLEATRTNEESEDFTGTLRNIYFVRERVKYHQEDLLQQEYLNAVKRSSNNHTKALKQWQKFTQLYSPHIKKFPEWAYNMAVNQTPTSYVTIDTVKLQPPKESEGYPLYWKNPPSMEDAVTLKYNSERCLSCYASTPERNLCCVGGYSKAFVYELDSGALIQQVTAEGYNVAVYLSTRTFWVGNNHGYMSVWSIDTGTEEWGEKLCAKGDVMWIDGVGEYVACGTGEMTGGIIGTIFIFDEERRNIIRSWSTELECNSYCFHSNNDVIISGHGGVMKCWNIDGTLVKTFQIGDGTIKCISASPKGDMIVCGFMDPKYKHHVKQLSFAGEGQVSTISNTFYEVVYDSTGQRVICADIERNIIAIYTADGTLLNKLKAHSSYICGLFLIPGTNDLLSAANDGCILFDLPDHKDDEECSNEVISWCGFLPGGNEYATVSNNKLQLWNTSSCQPGLFIEIEDAKRAVIHPGGAYICLYTKQCFYWLKTSNLETVYSCKVREDYTLQITDIKITSNGLKCIVVTYTHGVIVFDISHIEETREDRIYRMNGDIGYCDVHSDNVQVVSGGRTDGMEIWNMSTGQTVRSVYGNWTQHAKFLYAPDRLLYIDWDAHVHIMDLSGVHLLTFESKCTVEYKSIYTLLGEGARIMTAEEDKSLRLFDVRSGEVLYSFVNHKSEGFSSLAGHPSGNMVIAGNHNGTIYILKNMRTVSSQVVSNKPGDMKEYPMNRQVAFKPIKATPLPSGIVSM